jgi:DNA-binding NtrC family response regulator
MIETQVKVILLDDSESDLSILKLFAGKMGLETWTSTSTQQALQKIRQTPGPILLVSDISMPERTGFELLEILKKEAPQVSVIFVSGNQDLEYPVQAMRLGALDYLVKPVSYNVFEARLSKAIRQIETQFELGSLKQQIFHGQSFEGFVGESEAIKNIFQMISRIALYDSAVLITGESGVGKEKVARAVHNRSPRSKHEFVAINCAALPENLIESELFGHTKGAFTGADKDTPGLFVTADQGTIFLDEIGELPLILQAKLLRVLQDKEVRPVGGKKTVKVDARVICATHRNLENLVKEGKFREDLYFRLNVIPIHIPPLRERREDLNLLISHILDMLQDRWGVRKVLTDEARQYLETHPFPGNVRQLENMLERAFILSPENQITKEVLETKQLAQSPRTFFQLSDHLPSLKEIELLYIQEILKRSSTKDSAAQVLGIGRKTLYRKEFELAEFFDTAKTQ